MRGFLGIILFILLVGCQTTPEVVEEPSDHTLDAVTGHAVLEQDVVPDYTITLQTTEASATLSDAMIKKVTFVPKYIMVEPDSIVAFVNAGFPTEPVKIIRRDAHALVDLYKGDFTSEKPLYFHVTKPGAKYQLLCLRTECSASIEVKS